MGPAFANHSRIGGDQYENIWDINLNDIFWYPRGDHYHGC